MKKLENWWGYLHEDGSVHAKRVFEPSINGDIDEAIESPFVLYVVNPFWAKNRQTAILVIRKEAEIWLKSQK